MTGRKRGTARGTGGKSTFLLYMSGSVIIDDFTVGFPEHTIHLDYHVITCFL